MSSPRYIHRIDKIAQLTEEERDALKRVEEKFAFRSNDYYLSLIDWDDPDDPIRRIIIPDIAELEDWGKLDPSEESRYVVAPGLEHKYDQTALILVNDMCGGFCRYCFRKRLFLEKGREIIRDISPDIAYIASHPEITNVLLSGGDPLFLSTSRLDAIVREVRAIDHVRIIRIGTKMPAYYPFRIITDPSLITMIRKYSTPDRRIYVITQFSHPRELTDAAVQSIDMLLGAGAILANQTPILRGVNDDPDVLAELFRNLSFVGVAPYYVFQCRPALGNRHFVVPVEEAYGIIEHAKAQCSGLAKRVTFAMSHKCGKISVVGVDENHTYFKFHQAAEQQDFGKFMVFWKNPDALWFDDYTDLVSESYIG
ncbi:MAG: radical SAM protein [Methanoculleus sp. SDB]|nr:MAG: radical SAM protein [Methanoculleus sp. SDB]